MLLLGPSIFKPPQRVILNRMIVQTGRSVDRTKSLHLKCRKPLRNISMNDIHVSGKIVVAPCKEVCMHALVCRIGDRCPTVTVRVTHDIGQMVLR